MRIDLRCCENGTCEIGIDNSITTNFLFSKTIRYNFADDPMSKFIRVVKHFTKADEIFFGHYRIDGPNLTSEEWRQYDKEIPEHFKTYGRYELPATTVVKKGGKVKTYSGYLTVGSLPVNKATFDLMPKIFHYYLDTICFCPKISWETFVQSYSNYMEHGGRGYVMNGFADFVFSYCDSGCFSVLFNPQTHDPQALLNAVKKIISE